MEAERLALVVGSSGFVGGRLLSDARARWARGVGTWRGAVPEGPDSVRLDLDEFDGSALNGIETGGYSDLDAIVCASMAQIDECRRDPARSGRVNVENTRRLIERLVDLGYSITFFSTDQVFTDRAEPYREDEETDPINLYGEQKAEIEQFISESVPGSRILRLGKVVAHYYHPRNLFSEWKRRIDQDEDIPVIADQMLAPGSVADISRAAMQLISDRAEGVFHLSGRPVARAALAREFCARHPWYRGTVREHGIEEFGFLDRRSMHVILDGARTETAVGFSIGTPAEYQE